MKKDWIRVRVVLSLCAALGWWGILYPELTMTPDTYRVICGQETVQKEADVVEWDFDEDIYRDILNADRSQIRFKSKLLQAAEDYLKQAD